MARNSLLQPKSIAVIAVVCALTNVALAHVATKAKK
jgi:hypothetical protein